MAIDSVSKRFSIVNLGGDLMVLPKPDGTVGVKDRLNLISLYSGLGDTESGGGGAGPLTGIQMMTGMGR